MYKYRQIYKAENSDLCNKWIERINAGIIYFKFWKNLIEKNPEIAEFYSNQAENEEILDANQAIENAIEEEEKNENNGLKVASPEKNEKKSKKAKKKESVFI